MLCPRVVARAIAVFALLAFAALPRPAGAAEIVVFAAASLKDALDAITADWALATGNTVAVSYGGSAALAKQIQQGAPADLFLPAAPQWMDVLQADGLIRPETRVDLLGNELVLVAHGADAPPVALAPGLDLAGVLGDGWLSMGLVDAVPAGQYGHEALTSLGLWTSVAPRVVQSQNVRAALDLVIRGEAAMGIVFASDARAFDLADDPDGDAKGGGLTVVGRFPASSHSPIRYPVAMMADSEKPEAAALLQALSAPAAQAVFVAQGFAVLPR